MTKRPYSGVWPVAPTPFAEDGTLDLEGMRRVLDCMIDQGVDGICILANFSEQFLLSDEERATLTRLCLEHVAGRRPVIVTVSHFATQVVEARAREAAAMGAAMLMMMPPYHGTGLSAEEASVLEHFERAGAAGAIPIMVQDAPLSGVSMPVAFLARMARQIEQVRLFKIEVPQAAAKIRDLIVPGGEAVEGPFGGEEAITLMADLDAGSTGTMTSALLPDLVRPVVEAYLAGRRSDAAALYARILPLINFENRQCGWRACKEVMKEGGVIASATAPSDAPTPSRHAGAAHRARARGPTPGAALGHGLTSWGTKGRDSSVGRDRGHRDHGFVPCERKLCASFARSGDGVDGEGRRGSGRRPHDPAWARRKAAALGQLEAERTRMILAMMIQAALGDGSRSCDPSPIPSRGRRTWVN